MSFEAFQAPAWVLALATAAWMGAQVILKIKGNGHANGSLAPEIRTALQAVTITLTALTERLAHLPTKEELVTVAAQNRHDYRNSLQTTALNIENVVGRAEQNIIKEIGRSAA